VDGKNPYEILGLENGQQSTLDEIKKVWMLGCCCCGLAPRAGTTCPCKATPLPTTMSYAFLLQAYRRLALVKHPDKAKTPNAGLSSCCHRITALAFLTAQSFYS